MAEKKRPNKPYPEYPLYAHPSGKWAKVINYKTHYFGTWQQPEAALAEYLEALPYIKSGLTPPRGGGGYSIGSLCSDFYDHQLERHHAKEIGARHIKDIDDHNRYLLRFFGTTRNVETMSAADFAALRKRMAKDYKLHRLSNYITKTRALFNWAYKARKIKQPLDFGLDFHPPSRAAKKKERNTKPKKLFTAPECRLLTDNAKPQLRAMILLAINGGFGQTDLANLEFRHLNLDRAWIDFPRTKTGVDREVPLWPETVAAIKAAIEVRPAHKNDYSKHVFVTRFGVPWVRCSVDNALVDSITREFHKLKKSVGITAENKGFYALRHTFRTVADECKDQPAVLHLMGHSDDSISEIYREMISRERLTDIVNYVRKWYLKTK